MLVSHSDGVLDWEEVGCDILSFVNIVLLSLPKFLVDHLEAIGVVPELIVVVEVAEEFPVDDNILASFALGQLAKFGLNLRLILVGNWDIVEIHLDLQELGHV